VRRENENGRIAGGKLKRRLDFGLRKKIELNV
jgi:hypothetical protein